MSEKKTFLVAVEDESLRLALKNAIEKQVSNSVVFFACDGYEANVKINNAPPSVLIVTKFLPKVNGLKITEGILDNADANHTCVVILGVVPDEEIFVDEVVTGRVQFLDENELDEDSFAKALAKALNIATNDKKKEFSIRFFSTGDKVIQEGEPGNSVFLLKRGRLRAVLNRDGKDILLGHIEPGEFAGEMSYINGEPRSADVYAETESELIEIPVGLLDAILFKKPAWSKALMKTLSRRIKQGNVKKSG